MFEGRTVATKKGFCARLLPTPCCGSVSRLSTWITIAEDLSHDWGIRGHARDVLAMPDEVRR